MSSHRFDSRVAIVTGAGNGLGRSHALLLGSLGAKVVVNDLGGGAHGDGKSSAAADKVVDEIRAMGGEAVANYDSVEHGDKIVQTALDAFGTVDIVINNAGILRDVSFAKMTQADWDLILKVHLTGSMSVTHAAWPIMREKGYGRIIMTTSAAGIYGNFGQANYCAAKLGLVGLASCLAEEGRAKGIQVNTIAPIAASRLTETIMPPELLANLKPEKVSPLVAWLCHEDCEETKGVFEVGAGYIAKLRWERSLGHAFPLTKEFSLDDLAAKWDQVTDFTESEHPANVNDSFAPILHNINNPKLGGNEFIDLDEAVKGELVLENSYDERDVALYALGVGAARDPLDSEELNFVYELGANFQVLPTYGVMPQSNAMLAAAKAGGLKLPGQYYGFDRVLHGEQYTEIKRPLPTHAKLKHVFKFKEAFDKDPHAVVTFAVHTLDEDGEEVAYNEMTSFVRGAGGWGGDRGPSADVNVPPAREPDAVIEEKTDANQTLLYRLSGDWNPLHADPAFAKAFGFDKPILHGMCTFGYCGRHVIKAFSNNDPRYFKSIKVRFAKTVFPGETLITKMWKESDTRIVFETYVKERNEVVIKNAAIELFSEIPAAKAKANAVTDAPVAAAGIDESITVADVFAGIKAYVAAKPELVDQTKTSFQFVFHNPESSWFIDLKNGAGAVGSGACDKPDVTIELDAEHTDTLFGGDLAAVQKLYFGGKMKVHGNVMASNKLTVLSGMDKALVEAARKARVAAGANTSAASGVSEKAAPAADQGITLADVFGGIKSFVATKPELVEQTKTSFQFRFHNPDSNWFIDLKNAPGSVGAGEAVKPDVTIELDAEHADTLFGGDLAAVQKLFFGGQMKVSGNVMASNKLTVLSTMDKALVEEARAKRLASGASNDQAAVAVTATRESFAQQLMSSLAQKPLPAGQRQGVLQLRVSAPDSAWVINVSDSGVSVSTGETNAETVVSLADEHLEALSRGERKLAELYQRGELTVDGDVSLARALNALVAQ
ncbi:MAG: SDR family NAD(P)-dependent oxidoreductase [Moraxellaceae bacterium]|nr:SDR family NAD(P)-dependent oxidoreductase [Moraxellaceae bacterium]MDZ4385921.1 SDR family NAD(P)-dependent oxidoreductase [Moraxellaceae bacterium]